MGFFGRRPTPTRRASESLGKHRMQVLTLIRTKLFGKLSQSAKVLLLRFCPQLRHLVYE